MEKGLCPVSVDDGTEGLTRPPVRGHVGDVEAVGGQLLPRPQLQSLATSRHLIQLRIYGEQCVYMQYNISRIQILIAYCIFTCSHFTGQFKLFHSSQC